MNVDLNLTSLRETIRHLRQESVFVGTSSWKYPGWCGQIYDEARYITRKKFSESRFERECLTEYAETFPTVCVDAGYYKFPSPQYLEGLCAQVPDSFRFGFKVTDTITIKHYPKLPRFGDRAGKDNEHFLNAELFCQAFLSSCKRVRSKIGVLIFEFSHFHPGDFGHGRDFVAALDHFFSQLPKEWAYAVEVRNKSLLQPEYFSMLSSHGVAHVFNSWTKMPEVGEQLGMEGSITTDFTVARFLLKPGRTYEQAVTAFAPYKSVQEMNPSARDAAIKLIERSKGSKRPSFVFVNNRLEGNAIGTIKAVLDAMQT